MSPRSFLSKCCKGTTPFCIELDEEEDSYIIEVPDKD